MSGRAFVIIIFKLNNYYGKEKEKGCKKESNQKESFKEEEVFKEAKIDQKKNVSTDTFFF